MIAAQITLTTEPRAELTHLVAVPDAERVRCAHCRANGYLGDRAPTHGNTRQYGQSVLAKAWAACTTRRDRPTACRIPPARDGYEAAPKAICDTCMANAASSYSAMSGCDDEAIEPSNLNVAGNKRPPRRTAAILAILVRRPSTYMPPQSPLEGAQHLQQRRYTSNYLTRYQHILLVDTQLRPIMSTRVSFACATVIMWYNSNTDPSRQSRSLETATSIL